MGKNTETNKKLLYAIYAAVGIYVAVMYLLSAFRDDYHSYSIMMNLALAFGLFSGIVSVEADKAKRWFVPKFLGVLWIAGVAVDFVFASKTTTWDGNHIVRDITFLLFLLVPTFVIWALSKIKKGRNVIMAFVGAVFALFSLGFFPGRGKLEPLYDIVLVSLPTVVFALVVQYQSRRQSWLSLLVFLGVYSYIIIANPYVNLVMFVLVAGALLIVLGIMSASWNGKTKKKAFVALVCLMSAIAVIAIPAWSIYAIQRENFSEHAILVGTQGELESAFVTPENDTISLESLRGKTVGLYFWSASCGLCHAKMPDYSDLAESYANSPDKVFYAVFLSRNESDLKHYETTTSQDYAFQWARALNAEEVMEKLKFNAFPHLTIISPDGTVAYNGMAEFHPLNVNHPKRYLK